jgi:hypothetical protein
MKVIEYYTASVLIDWPGSGTLPEHFFWLVKKRAIGLIFSSVEIGHVIG